MNLFPCSFTDSHMHIHIRIHWSIGLEYWVPSKSALADSSHFACPDRMAKHVSKNIFSKPMPRLCFTAARLQYLFWRPSAWNVYLALAKSIHRRPNLAPENHLCSPEMPNRAIIMAMNTETYWNHNHMHHGNPDRSNEIIWNQHLETQPARAVVCLKWNNMYKSTRQITGQIAATWVLQPPGVKGQKSFVDTLLHGIPH